MSATAAGWSRPRERGNASLTRLAAWLILRFGWLAGQMMMMPVAAWFIVASRPARIASRGFLALVLGRPAGTRDVSRHFLCCANIVLDRLFMLAGRIAAYEFEVEGLEALRAELDRGRGCLLLGSHLGSFEAVRAIAADCPQRIRPMMYRANGAAPTRLLESLNPALARDIIEIGTFGAMLEAREAIGRGEILGLLGDRAHRGEKSKTIEFLGHPASFPTGPMLLAGALGAPVFLFFAPRVGSRRYRIIIEPFCDGAQLRHGDRDATVDIWLRRYVARLEQQCRAHPFNWFNFFDFWGAFADAGSATGAMEPVVPGLAAGLRRAGQRGDGSIVLGRDADARPRLGAPAP